MNCFAFRSFRLCFVGLLLVSGNFCGSNKPFALKMASGVRDCCIFPVNYSNNCFFCKDERNMQILCVAAGRVFNFKACGTDSHSIPLQFDGLIVARKYNCLL